MVQSVGVPCALIDQVKLVFVCHTNHVIILSCWPIDQCHDNWRITQADLLCDTQTGNKDNGFLKFLHSALYFVQLCQTQAEVANRFANRS